LFLLAEERDIPLTPEGSAGAINLLGTGDLWKARGTEHPPKFWRKLAKEVVQ
jgi:hypothetical protein